MQGMWEAFRECAVMEMVESPLFFFFGSFFFTFPPLLALLVRKRSLWFEVLMGITLYR